MIKQEKQRNPRLLIRGFPLHSISTDQCANIANKRSATIFVILIMGFTAGPAVSL